MNRSAHIFFQFLWRDTYIYSKQIKTYLFNYGIIRPILYAFSLAYINANLLFESNQVKICTHFLIGSSIFIGMVLSFVLGVKLLFDFEKHRFIAYQVSLLNPKLVILEKILFASLFVFFIWIPFFPISKLLIQSNLYTEHACWTQVFLMLYLSSLCCAAYHYLIACTFNSKNLGGLWSRINAPMIILGGLFVPFYIIKQFAPKLSWICYLNPVTYMTEGLRSAMIGGKEFISVFISAIALIIFSVLLTLATFYFFKKRVDHI